ncbi:MAG: hypothetical protein Fur0042_28060 [Cyanophyceae cyanobacterium]
MSVLDGRWVETAVWDMGPGVFLGLTDGGGQGAIAGRKSCPILGGCFGVLAGAMGGGVAPIAGVKARGQRLWQSVDMVRFGFLRGSYGVIPTTDG